MLIDDLLERNREFVQGRRPGPLPAAEPVSLAVVACFDPRLDALLRPALGLRDGEGFMLRTAGAVLAPGSHALRSLAVAVYLFEVEQVLIVGHTSCKMADFPTGDLIAVFRRRGVSREAFGDGDLRSWAGATASPRAGVLGTASAIAEAPFLPPGLGIAGAVLDDASGALEMVLRPDDPLPGQAPGKTREPPPSRPSAAPAPEPAGAQAAEAETQAAGASPGAVPPGGAPPIPAEALHPALGDLRQSVLELAAGTGIDDLRHLSRAVRTEVYPMNKLALLQRFFQRAAADSPEVQQAFDLLQRQVEDAGHDLATRTLGELFGPLFRHPGGGPTDGRKG